MADTKAPAPKPGMMGESFARLRRASAVAWIAPYASQRTVVPLIFALAVLFSGKNDLLIGARRGSPLAVGYGEGEMYLGSDALALGPRRKQRLAGLSDRGTVQNRRPHASTAANAPSSASHSKSICDLSIVSAGDRMMWAPDSRIIAPRW